MQSSSVSQSPAQASQGTSGEQPFTPFHLNGGRAEVGSREEVGEDVVGKADTGGRVSGLFVVGLRVKEEGDKVIMLAGAFVGDADPGDGCGILLGIKVGRSKGGLLGDTIGPTLGPRIGGFVRSD
mmetsp:Transcript_16613/g.34692  ORF Transcript_16613/g.34692 Transcript_16613/m.34692 type:complete len:125 (-) Transcript_16613:64-438(-)